MSKNQVVQVLFGDIQAMICEAASMFGNNLFSPGAEVFLLCEDKVEINGQVDIQWYLEIKYIKLNVECVGVCFV